MSEAPRPGYQNRVSYHATLLGGFAVLSAAMLILGDITTRADIAERHAEDMKASLSQVILPELYDNDLLAKPLQLDHKDRPVKIYRGTKKGKVTALAYTVSDFGYGGEIVLMMGVNANGSILGVRVLTHAETPGLGDKIEVEKASWITSFNGLTVTDAAKESWAVKKDGGRFDQFSGATITPRAVVRAVKSGLEFFNTHRAEILRLEPDKPAAKETPKPKAAKDSKT